MRNANWKRVPIESVYHGLYDGPHATPKPSDEGPIFLGIKNITEDGHLNLTAIRHIAESEFARWTRRVEPQPDDIVFTYEATLNRYALIPNGFRGCLGRRLALIRPDVTKVDPKFLLLYFFGSDWRDTIATNITSGSTVDRIPLLEFPSFKISLPPLTTQRKIASILSAYDDLIDNNTRRIAILEEMAQAIYREWFVNFRFPGHENVKLVDSPLGQIPEGWEAKTLESVLAFYIGGGWGKEVEEEGFTERGAVIRGTDIPNAKHLNVSTCPTRFHKESNIRSRRLQNGDIVFEVSGGSKGQPVGRAVFVSDRLLACFDDDVICASFCKLIRPNEEKLCSSLFFHYLLESYTNGIIEQYEVQSTGIKNFKFTEFIAREHITVPPTEIQHQFVTYFDAIQSEIEILGKKTSNLRTTRDLLLPKLISGKLDVEDLDIDTGLTAEALEEATA